VRLGKKFLGKKKDQFVYSKSFQVVPSAPNGIEMLDVQTVVPEELQAV
jgi:hypothetical protein